MMANPANTSSVEALENLFHALDRAAKEALRAAEVTVTSSSSETGGAKPGGQVAELIGSLRVQVGHLLMIGNKFALAREDWRKCQMLQEVSRIPLCRFFLVSSSFLLTTTPFFRPLFLPGNAELGLLAE